MNNDKINLLGYIKKYNEYLVEIKNVNPNTNTDLTCDSVESMSDSAKQSTNEINMLLNNEQSSDDNKVLPQFEDKTDSKLDSESTKSNEVSKTTIKKVRAKRGQGRKSLEKETPYLPNVHN